jgi:diacylglycerol kinase family enzyme
VRSHDVRTLEAAPVHADAEIPIELDGETPGRLPARFDVLPGALRIRF